MLKSRPPKKNWHSYKAIDTGPFELNRRFVPGTFEVSVKGMYVTLPMARLHFERAMIRLEHDRSEWKRMKRTMVDDPVESTIRPLDPALLLEFLRFGAEFEKEHRRLRELYRLIDTIYEN